MRVTFVFIVLCFLIGCANRSNDDAYKLDSIDPTNKPKTYFATEDSLQTLEITWVNDTLIIPELIINEGKNSSTCSAILINKFPTSDPEIFEDEKNNGYAVTAYTIEEKSQQIYRRIDIALDTSFAVIKDWEPETGGIPLRFNKMMRRVR